MPVTNINTPAQHHEAISDLIGNPPSWLLRSGITMIGIVVASIIALSSIIKYPDTIKGQGILIADSPPIELIARSNGYIDKILVPNGQTVRKGQTLLYINNTTDQNAIEVLKKWITKYNKIKDPRKYLNLKFPQKLQLGAIQQDYAMLKLKYDELSQHLKNGIVFRQMNQITEEINKIKTLNQSQKREKGIYEEELSLQETENTRQEALLGDGIISQQDLENSKTSLLQKKRQYESMENRVIQNQILMEQLELKQLQLQGERADLIRSYQFAINQIITQIETSILSWTNQYAIAAPIEGTLHYASSSIKEKKTLSIEQLVGHIVPIESSSQQVICQVDMGSAGKLESGQKCIIRFPAYPYKEYGQVESKLTSISTLPYEDAGRGSQYELIINLPDSIVTDVGYHIPYKPKLSSSVEIITEDNSILERILEQFLSLAKQLDL